MAASGAWHGRVQQAYVGNKQADLIERAVRPVLARHGRVLFRRLMGDVCTMGYPVFCTIINGLKADVLP